MSDLIQALWDNILSEESEKIKITFESLDSIEQQYVLVHLFKMINEPGWHPAQVQTAQKAINVIEDNK